MNFTYGLGGLALIMLGLTACEPSKQTGALSTMRPAQNSPYCANNSCGTLSKTRAAPCRTRR